jgi:hypothetical protein
LVTVCHAAHYHAIFASLLKRCTPTGGKGGLQTDTSRQRNHGLRARYEPRGFESQPSTGVQQLPSSKQSKGHLRADPYKAMARATFSRRPQTYSRIKERLTVECPGGKHRALGTNHTEPRSIRQALAFWRAPPRSPADPYQTGHGLPPEFPASSSPRIIETRPSRVVRCSHPSSLPKGCVRVDR